jgi:hypothetical protein
VNQKLLIILLVAIVVIFLITLGISGCHGSGKPDADNPGAVGALKGLQGKHFLKIGDKATATCAPPGAVTFTVSGPCTINIQKRAFFRTATRVIFRRCTSSSCQNFTKFPFFQVQVVPKNGPTQNEQIVGKSCFATAVGREGGTITLNGNAIITLVKQPCPKE